jgi:hypothetical protein
LADNKDLEPTDISKAELGGTDCQPKSVRDFIDLNNDISGSNSSRMSRFLTSHEKGVDLNEKEERYKNHAMQILFEQVYQEDLKAAMQTLHEVQGKVYEALTEALENAQDTKAAYTDLLSNASTLPDGTKVFLDGDKAFTEDGSELSQEEFETVTFKENAPTWEDFKLARDNVVETEERLQLVQRHSERVEEIEQELIDKPDSTERVQELNDELDGIKQSIDAKSDSEISLLVESPVSLPSLNI